MPSGVYKHKPNQGFQKNNQFAKGKKYFNRYGKKAPNWKGGKIKDAQGYFYIWQSNHPFGHNNYVKRARLIIEKYIKRFLKPSEIVHHFNKIKDDDRPENLMAFSSNSAHLRFHGNPDNIKSEEIIFDGRNL